jgi:membrane protein YqaA with SNARE-associated domain
LTEIGSRFESIGTTVAMHRSFALSLGAIAMALVALRGAVRNELAAEVALEAILALVLFAIMGAFAGAIADYLIRDDLERQYRRKVAWYCEQQERHVAIKK